MFAILRKKRPIHNPEAKNISSTDIYIGNNIALTRAKLGMTMLALANAVGVTHQQIAKYENGINRVSASRLYCISKATNTPIQKFFNKEPWGA